MEQHHKKIMQKLTSEWTAVQPDVFSYVAAIIPNFHDAQDVVQKVAVVIVDKYEQYDSKRFFREWVLGITRLEILKYRQNKAREKLVFSENLIDRLTELHQHQKEDEKDDLFCHALRHCLKSVRGRRRVVLDMWYTEEVNADVIAKELVISKNTVYSIIHRVRNFLRTCVERRLASMEEIS
ncbi:sigma-70 family RNA polymerase sigma factor [Planctomycetota bacterium]